MMSSSTAEVLAGSRGADTSKPELPLPTIIVAPTPDEQGKFSAVVRAFPAVWSGTLLDVGCRSGNLRRVLPDHRTRYVGVDLGPPANVLANLDGGLPIREGACDTVVALDVLEHTDAIHRAFGELCRVARRWVVLTLPNGYESGARLKFFRGRAPSGKYGLPLAPPVDRHRWLFSLAEARAFTHELGERFGFEVESDAWLVGPRRGRFPFSVLVRRYPNLLSPTYLGLLRRVSAQ